MTQHGRMSARQFYMMQVGREDSNFIHHLLHLGFYRFIFFLLDCNIVPTIH